MKIILYSLAAVVLVGVISLAYYFIAPSFITIVVNDAPPAEALVVTPAPALDTNEVKNKATDMATPTTVVAPPQSVKKKSIQLPPAKAETPIPISEQKTVASIVGTPGHKASGTARLITTPQGAVVRYEIFKTINGPDLFVYLASDVQATEFVDLGPLKATEGNINYTVPASVDVAKYPYVLVWCKQFGVLFNSVKIQ